MPKNFYYNNLLVPISFARSYDYPNNKELLLLLKLNQIKRILFAFAQIQHLVCIFYIMKFIESTKNQMQKFIESISRYFLTERFCKYRTFFL